MCFADYIDALIAAKGCISIYQCRKIERQSNKNEMFWKKKPISLQILHQPQKDTWQ